MTSLIDKIKNNKNINVSDEINKIIKISKAYYDEKHAINEGYLKSPFNVIAININDAIEMLCENYDGEIDLFRDICELYLTSIHFINDYYTDGIIIKQIESIIKNDLRILGYEPIFDEDEQVFRSKLVSPEAEIVSCNTSKEISEKINNYLCLKYHEVEEKRKELKSLCDDVERYCSSSKDNNIKKLRQFYQCVRHTKDNPKKEFPFYYEDESKYLDMIFEMIVDVLGYIDLESKVKEIIKLENNGHTI